MSLRVALYYPWLYLRSGAERKIAEVTGRSRHRFTIYTNHYDREQTYPEFERREVVELARISVQRSIRAVLQGSSRVLLQKLPLSGHDALVVVSDGVGDLVTLRNHPVPVVCILSTPLRIVFDPVYRAEYMKAQRNPLVRGAVRCFGGAFVWVDRLAWRNYQRVLCNSEETYQRALRGKLAPPERLEVLNPGIDYRTMLPTWEYGDYFLLPGRIKWTKSVEMGLTAHALYRQAGGRLRLVVAGQVDKKSQAYFERLREQAAATGGVEFVVNPEDPALFALYRNAYAVLMTSLNEDWGMVPLEGMSFGKPVIAVAQGGPLTSVVDGQTGYLVKPTAEAFAAAMARLGADPAHNRRLGEQARAHAARFDWSHYVDRLDNVLEEIYSRTRRR